MADPVCKHCGSEDVVWARTNNGKWALYDTRHPHVASCKARKRNMSDPREQAVSWLVGMKFSKTEARALIAKVPADDVTEMVGAALKLAGWKA